MINRYTIVTGDTIHHVARRLLGNADQWIVLAQYNELDYPHIDTSNAVYPGKKVLTVGDTLLVPIGLDGPDVQRAGIEDSPDPYGVLFGTDLVLTDGDLVENAANSDWKVNVGIANLQQALTHRMRTRKGELPYHPEYGSNLQQHIGRVMDSARVSLMRLEVTQNILGDPRIRSISRLDMSDNSDHFDINVTAEVIGQDDVVPLNLVIPKQAA